MTHFGKWHVKYFVTLPPQRL